MTEVLRHRNSLSIRWPDYTGNDLWTVAKKFSLGTRELQPATVEYTGRMRFGNSRDADRTRIELCFAVHLAQMMDRYLQRPDDFDRVAMDNEPALGGYPALLRPRDDGKIYIATTPD